MIKFSDIADLVLEGQELELRMAADASRYAEIQAIMRSYYAGPATVAVSVDPDPHLDPGVAEEVKRFATLDWLQTIADCEPVATRELAKLLDRTASPDDYKRQRDDLDAKLSRLRKFGYIEQSAKREPWTMTPKGHVRLLKDHDD